MSSGGLRQRSAGRARYLDVNGWLWEQLAGVDGSIRALAVSVDVGGGQVELVQWERARAAHQPVAEPQRHGDRQTDIGHE